MKINLSLLDQMINKATKVLADKAESFKRVKTTNNDDHKIFNVTQEEIDAMVLNIPTP